MVRERHSRLWLPGLIILLPLLIGVVIGKGWERTGYASETYEELKIFTEVLTQVKKHYVEEVSNKDLVYGAIRGMLSTLDPHSSFMTPEMYNEMQIETKGEFGGVGIQIGIKENRLTVISPIEGTPAYRAGIEAGDHISKVDGEITKDMTLMEAVQRMRGPKGTKVTLTVERKGTPEPMEFTIIRDIIKIKSVRSKVLDDTIGYIRLTQFQEASGSDLHRALEELGNKKIDALILDLRNNPGGLLTAAVEVSEQFLEGNKLIVSIKDRDGRVDEYRARSDGKDISMPMIVLVNEGSASASEIVAGALQDWGKALIVGTKTFGKGSVQTILPLSDGSGLRLTTAKYYTPKGRVIQANGVKPDIEVTRDGATVAQASTDEGKRPTPNPGAGAERPLPGANNGGAANTKTGEEAEDEKQEREDVQLRKAIELLKSWRVFKDLEAL